MTDPKLCVRLPVGADLEAAQAVFRSDPGRWLPQPARPRGPGRWAVTVRAGPLARTVECAVGDVWEVDFVLWRRLSWAPEDEAGEILPMRGLLPVLAGALGLEEDAGRPVLVFEAGYTPPAGIAGGLLDKAALHRVAAGTARRFADEVIDRLAATAPAPPGPGGPPSRRPPLRGGTPAAS